MSSVSELLISLRTLQSSGHSVYLDGLFASQRYHSYLPYLREDDNLFFSATIAYTLQSHLSLMSKNEQVLSIEIVNSVIGLFPHFRNKDGKPTYNFWQTDPSNHFPNGMFMKRFEHFRIPDDADDTALVFLLQDHISSDRKKLSELLRNHANLGKKTIKNTWPEFKGLNAISTFFGEKMRIEFDAVVMCNVLLILFRDGEEGAIKEDSIQYISKALEADYHMTEPFYMSSNYPEPELIIYHVSRLLYSYPDCSLKKHKSKLIRQLEILINRSLPPLNELVARNALLLLGNSSEPNHSLLDNVRNDSKGYFFHAGMLSSFENSIAQKWSSTSLFHLRFRCLGLNLALLVEHELLKRKKPNV